MAPFRKDNGRSGIDMVYHTATGYECRAIICRQGDCCKEIIFFAKNITSLKGKPYTDIGFRCNEKFDVESLYLDIKTALEHYGLKNTTNIEAESKYSMSFMRYNTVVPKTLEVRICGGDDGILIAFYALSNFIHPLVREFVREQEIEVDDVLYKSLWECLGNEMAKGPGGLEHTQKHLREIANGLIRGKFN